MRASQSGRLSRLTSRLPAADDGEKPAETPCFSCDRSSAAGAPSYSTSARCALLGQRRNTRNKQPNLEGYDGVAEARAAGRPASMGSLLGSQPLRGRAATRPLPEWLPRHVAHESASAYDTSRALVLRKSNQATEHASNTNTACFVHATVVGAHALRRDALAERP
ncbi:hypothetical protein HPB50_007426 [Hyalomma asiaticum]|uniref:Uncharacterized protein n=1 Tax=Hyalomma asiaticum TaxID=266040 RepID=A0ACB7TG81_HYAAI|nr:hypothetical protein HPB50_007426 [Hyalomma asiaticum]